MNQLDKGKIDWLAAAVNGEYYASPFAPASEPNRQQQEWKVDYAGPTRPVKESLADLIERGAALYDGQCYDDWYSIRGHRKYACALTAAIAAGGMYGGQDLSLASGASLVRGLLPVVGYDPTLLIMLPPTPGSPYRPNVFKPQVSLAQCVTELNDMERMSFGRIAAWLRQFSL